MKAAVLTAPCNLEIRDVPIPEPGPGQVRLQVMLAGICGSDNTLYHGKFGVPMPVIPGHEAVCRVERLGPGVSGFSVGQRVTIQPNLSCGTCPPCAAGHENLCLSKTRLGVDADGVFAEYAAVPVNRVWPVPDDLENEVAVFTEPLAVAVHAMKIASPNKGDRALIFGAGVMGLLVQQMAVLNGAEVTACDLSETRLAVAKQLGSTQLIGPNDPIESFFGQFDLLYETSGAAVALAQMIQLAAARATIVILGLPGTDHPIPIDMVVRKELQIKGSLIYTDEFPKTLEILQGGQIQTEVLTTEKVPLEEIDRVLRDFSSPKRIKMLVEI
jgi:2-desacetyl-2-hydroxyethyl bacteriochlorophyllide A dehydrogenase